MCFRQDRTHRCEPSDCAAALQGFNCRHKRNRGLDFWAVSNISADELTEFVDKFEAAAKAKHGRIRRYDDRGWRDALRYDE